MHYINLRFTYLLTYLLRPEKGRDVQVYYYLSETNMNVL